MDGSGTTGPGGSKTGGGPDRTFLALDPHAFGRLMPLYLWIAPSGQILGAGPTLLKLIAADRLIGRYFFDVFTLRRPKAVAGMADLVRQSGIRIHLSLSQPPHTGFKGVAVPLAQGQGVVLNLSFGINAAQAVREHSLTDADFAPTDLTVEMLYLTEAKSAVMEEMNHLASRLRQAKSTAEEQALSDTLTGLRNRRALDRALKTATEGGPPFGLMHLDLDFFKEVNDTLGHAAGDHVLQCMARILLAETRSGDVVARVGGDEFVVLFPGMDDPDRIARIANRILLRLQEPILFEGEVCRVSASIGTTLSSLYAEPEPDRLSNDADHALYVSKRQGRSRATAFAAGILPA